jgi:N-acetyltransferase 10
MLSKSRVKTRPSVLWCYKKDLGFSSHKKKKIKHVQSMASRGLLDADTDDPFELFVASTNIRYCYYKETQKILGNTFGMLVLQVRVFSLFFNVVCIGISHMTI